MPDAAPKRMNVVHVMSDQHHAGMMGCAGHPQAITPHLDQLAASGVRFTQAYTQNPICTPSRVTTLSGQYCHNHGYYGLAGPANFLLPSWLGHFKQHGYRTAAIGKLHLPNNPSNWILDHVDTFADSYEHPTKGHGQSAYFDGLEADGIRHLEDASKNRTGHYSSSAMPLDARPSDLPYERTQERWCVDQALQFIDEGKQQPFCVHVALSRPHHPLFPQQQFWDMYPQDIALPETINQDPSHRPAHFQKMWQWMRTYKWPFNQPGQTWIDGARRAWRGTLACITQVDDVMGHLLAGLEARGVRDNTIIVYHSDHGCYHGIHGLPEKAPGISSDDICRVPFIWHVPGVNKPGHVSDQLVELVDVANTLTHLCGLPAMTTTNGCDLSPLLRGDSTPVRNVAVTENPMSKSIRFGDFRLVHYQPEMFGQDTGELYNLTLDPTESRNLYHDPAHAQIVHQGRQLLLEWLIRTTRYRTMWPSALPLTNGYQLYETASDGYESNTAGPQQRIAEGKVHYL